MKTTFSQGNTSVPWIIAVQRPRPLRIATPNVPSRALPSARSAYLSALRAAILAVASAAPERCATN
jgi:hypothetical protein